MSSAGPAMRAASTGGAGEAGRAGRRRAAREPGGGRDRAGEQELRARQRDEPPSAAPATSSHARAPPGDRAAERADERRA